MILRSFLRGYKTLEVMRFNRSRLSYVCKAWKEKFGKVLDQPDNVSKETWEEMRKYAIDSEFKPSIVDTIILQMCANQKCPEVGISYYKFLESNNYNISMPTLSAYLNLYTLKSDPLTETEKKHVLSLCKTIVNQYVSLNSELTNVIVKCLLWIGEWEEAVKVIENYKDQRSYVCEAYSALTAYFYDNGKEDLGYKYFIDSFKIKKGPMKNAYDAYLKYCLKEKDKFNERIEQLFMLWKKHGIKPTHQVLIALSDACNKFGWLAESTMLLRSRCSVCKQALKETDLTDEEYKCLRDVTVKKLIADKMYYTTNPQEIQSYMKYIDKNKPYNVIIDGLNIYYGNLASLSLIQRSVKAYKRQGKKILVIGKRHMKKLVDTNNIQHLADFYYVHNWSQDDLFILYAAFSSGKDAILMSNDFMRQHRFATDDFEVTALFKRWQAVHQFLPDETSGLAFRADGHAAVNSITHKINNSWHIPYVDLHSEADKSRTECQDWFCFKMPQNTN